MRSERSSSTRAALHFRLCYNVIYTFTVFNDGVFPHERAIQGVDSDSVAAAK